MRFTVRIVLFLD